MSTEDFGLWLRYRATLRPKARALYFDSKLGGDAALNTTAPGLPARYWYNVNAKRADVVADLGAAVRIIELRTSAQANAVGRLLTYKLLWERDPAIPKPLQLELVTDTMDPDVADACAAYGIIYTRV